MAIHVQDEVTDGLVREFARRRGIGITAAIRTAVEEASQRETQELKLLSQRIEPIVAQIRARRTARGGDDKAFMDEMWGED